MKKLALLSFLVLFSFAAFAGNPSDKKDWIGTYGVSQNDPAQIELQLLEDGTFSYQDFSDTQNKLKISGNWHVEKGHLILEDEGAASTFHSKWKLDGNAIKSRKGMTFYRLCRKN